MENEIWKDIKGYEGLYQISNLGRVKSLPKFHKNHKSGLGYLTKERILVSGKTKLGYEYVNFVKSSIWKRYYVHRLVAETFIENPDNLPCVNHKDEDKQNNCVENLEWCTHKYNSNYGTIKDRISNTCYSLKLIWITNGIVCKRIKNDLLDYYIMLGFRRGRKING